MEERKVRPLRAEYKKNGYQYKHNFSTTNGYHCYTVMDRGRVVAFEVFRHRVRKLSDFFAIRANRADVPKEYDYYTAFPGNEDFGTRAWNLPSIERVHEKIAADLIYQAELR